MLNSHKGIPHKLRSDDVYKGMHIPGGAIVMGNVWYVTLSHSIVYPLLLMCRLQSFLGVYVTTQSVIQTQ